MSKIPYCDETWPVVTGCSKVSPGCARCWSERISHRFKTTTLPWTPENAAENVVLHPENLDRPLHWRRPRTVFVCATSDLFHEQVPDEFIDRVFGTMLAAKRFGHSFLVLTKRAERMRHYVVDIWPARACLDLRSASFAEQYSHVWLGVTSENQRMADERIPRLLDTPAAHRWASLEPLLGPMNVRCYLGCRSCGYTPRDEEVQIDHRFCQEHPDRPRLDAVVVGGESGSGYRAMPLEWVRDIKDQCDAAGVAYYGKQMAGPREGIHLPGELGDRAWPR